MTTWDCFRQHQQHTALLRGTHALLEWDQQTKMPPEAAEFRSEQIAVLAEWIHQRNTAPEVSRWLDELREQPQDDEALASMIHELDRRFQKDRKVPDRLVSEMARATSQGQTAWVEARKKDDFAGFLPFLENIIRLKIEYAECVGFEDHIYDALLDDYEPYQTTANVAAVLNGLRDDLVPLVNSMVASGAMPDRTILRRHYQKSAQRKLGLMASKSIGFDYACGRLDVTHHPFCTTLGPKDIRLTTRYDEAFLPTSLFGTLHESGHGMYEQGLPSKWHGLPLGSHASLGIHESQSRLWENMVGRGLPFWEHFYPVAQRLFPDALGDVSLSEFHFAINDVQPSLIRVEADEATYNLHIIIRFEMEQALLTGDLPARDAPAAWNDKYEQYLGVRPQGDADGVMQDVHWSAGLFGYFPTYSLGNLYAAQLFASATDAIGGLDDLFRKGEFAPLRQWLQTNVYDHGQRYPAGELAQRACGEPLSHKPLIEYLSQRFARFLDN